MNKMTFQDERKSGAVTSTAMGLRQAVFLHIQKTGGTSIIGGLRPYYGSLCSHGDCWGRPSAEFWGPDFVSGHVGYSYFEDLIKDRYSFTVLRDPVERIISLYYFCRKRDPQEYEIYQRAHTMSFEEFLNAGFTDKLVKDYIWNNQTWQLACGYEDPKGRCHDDFGEDTLLELAQEHLAAFSRVGTTEALAEDAALIAADLGLKDGVTVKPSNVTPDRPRREDLSPAAREMLQDLTLLDSELCQHAVRFHSEKKQRCDETC